MVFNFCQKSSINITSPLHDQISPSNKGRAKKQISAKRMSLVLSGLSLNKKGEVFGPFSHICAGAMCSNFLCSPSWLVLWKAPYADTFEVVKRKAAHSNFHAVFVPFFSWDLRPRSNMVIYSRKEIYLTGLFAQQIIGWQADYRFGKCSCRSWKYSWNRTWPCGLLSQRWK